MSVEIDFSYLIDGSFDTVNYYRSLTTMNPSAMPAPTATGITMLTYTDATATLDQTYFVRFGSVKNGVEKISSELTFKAKYTDQNYLIKLNTATGQLRDNGTLGNSWAQTNVTIDAESGVLFGAYQSFLLSDKTFNFNQDFKISFDLKRTLNDAAYPSLFNNADNGVWDSSVQRFNIAVGGATAISTLSNKVFIARSGGGTDNIAVNKTIANDVFYHIRFERAGNIFTLAVDDVVQTFTDARTYDLRAIIIGLGKDNATNGQFGGYIKNFRAEKLA